MSPGSISRACYFGVLPCSQNSWWRHQMETFSALLAICAGNSPVTGEFPAQRPVTRSFAVFFDLRLNKRLSKQWWGLGFETPSRPSWRRCNVWNPFQQRGTVYEIYDWPIFKWVIVIWLKDTAPKLYISNSHLLTQIDLYLDAFSVLEWSWFLCSYQWWWCHAIKTCTYSMPR